MIEEIKANQITKEMVKFLLPKRLEGSNKGTYGKVLNIAGSLNYPGAAFFSSISALRVGAGLSTLATVSSIIPMVASNSPDITFLDLGESSYGSIPKDGYKYLQDESATCISIGCGLGVSSPTKDFMQTFLDKNSKSQTPIVIDADAINIISQIRKPNIPLNSILTPHPGELSRLMKVDVATIESNRIHWAWEAAKKYDCIVLLKGHKTVVAIPNGQIFVNSTGNTSLSKGGTGDILTGMIAGFAAQGLNLESAATLAAYLHGRAGELAGSAMGEHCVLASNIIGYIPLAMKELI